MLKSNWLLLAVIILVGNTHVMAGDLAGAVSIAPGPPVVSSIWVSCFRVFLDEGLRKVKPMGDLDGDRRITKRDVDLIFKIAMGSAEVKFDYRADLNGDGAVTPGDARIAAQLSLGNLGAAADSSFVRELRCSASARFFPNIIVY